MAVYGATVEGSRAAACRDVMRRKQAKERQFSRGVQLHKDEVAELFNIRLCPTSSVADMPLWILCNSSALILDKSRQKLLIIYL